MARRRRRRGRRMNRKSVLRKMARQAIGTRM